MAKLAEFEDPQAAMYLLRLSYGIVRANHFMRTTPLSQWEQVAIKFDDCVRETVARASLCFHQDWRSWHSSADHASGAFTASWHESMQTAGEQWTAPVSCPPQFRPQSVASAAVDRAAFDGFIFFSRSSIRDAQRLHRLDVPHANAWI